MDIVLGFVRDVLVNLGLIVGILGAIVGALFCFGILGYRAAESGSLLPFEVFKRYACSVLASSDLHFDADGFDVEGPGNPGENFYRVPIRPNPTMFYHYRGWWCCWNVGNVVIYIWPVVKPGEYIKRNDPNDGFGKGEEVLLHDLQREFTNKTAETKIDSTPGASIATTSATPSWIYRMMVACVGLFVYRTPKSVVKDVDGIMEAETRYIITQLTAAELQVITPAEVWSRFFQRPGTRGYRVVNDLLLSRWGVRIMPESIEIRDLGFSARMNKHMEDRQAAKLKGEADAEGLNAFGEGLMASELGFATVAELKAKIAADPTYVSTPDYVAAAKYVQDMKRRKHAADNGELNDVRVGGTTGGQYQGNVWVGAPGGPGRPSRKGP